MKFSTKDQDNDLWSRDSCARKCLSGWWHKSCHFCNLNGQYLNGKYSTFADVIKWYAWTGYTFLLKSTKMMIRRQWGNILFTSIHENDDLKKTGEHFIYSNPRKWWFEENERTLYLLKSTKIMIRKKNEPGFFSCTLHICLYSCEKNINSNDIMLKMTWGNIWFDPHNLPNIWFFISQNVRIELTQSHDYIRYVISFYKVIESYLRVLRQQWSVSCL